MPRYCGWSEQDVKYVRRMNSLRNKAAHGEGFEGTRQDVEQYLSFVENAIAKGGFSSSEISNSSDSQYFSNNIREGGAVKPFRFWIERSDRGVKIFNRQGVKVISLNANNQKSGGIHFVKIFLAISITIITCLMLFGAMLLKSGVMFILAMLGITALALIDKFSSSSNISVFITSDLIYIGKKSYPIQGMYFKATFQNIGLSSQRLYKVGIIQHDKVIHFAQDLTWHEADELIKIAAKATSMINDSIEQFSIKSQDELIFIKSLKTDMSFVLEHNDRLWQSLRCRTVKNNANVVELTKSELKELYSIKLQQFSV